MINVSQAGAKIISMVMLLKIAMVIPVIVNLQQKTADSAR